MPTVADLLKSEILRLSRKAVRQQVEPLRALAQQQRRELARQKKQIDSLASALARLQRQRGDKREPAPKDDASAGGQRLRFVAKGLRSHRARLGLSAEDFGRLIGVTGKTIYNWETGKSVPRRRQLADIAAVRALGKREARARLSTAEPGRADTP